ncbi:MAG TPA: hypothetical protein VGU64_10200 [Terriglobales bacterium]|nr:hypothetical protein [Terriglobales bacterium]
MPDSMRSDLVVETWSVISERGVEASGLTYEEARRLVHKLGGEGRHGLCIITDPAAIRMSSAQPTGAEAKATRNVAKS